MQDDGRLVFGAYTGQINTITSPDAYNNGQWHHVVATQSGSGMKLYVDGALVGTNPQSGNENYVGYWKVGGDITWGSSSNYLDGRIDEVAVYMSELSPARVAAHFAAAAPANQPPTAAFTATTNLLTATFDSTVLRPRRADRRTRGTSVTAPPAPWRTRRTPTRRPAPTR